MKSTCIFHTLTPYVDQTINSNELSNIDFLDCMKYYIIKGREQLHTTISYIDIVTLLTLHHTTAATSFTVAHPSRAGVAIVMQV